MAEVIPQETSDKKMTKQKIKPGINSKDYLAKTMPSERYITSN